MSKIIFVAVIRNQFLKIQALIGGGIFTLQVQGILKTLQKDVLGSSGRLYVGQESPRTPWAETVSLSVLWGFRASWG